MKEFNLERAKTGAPVCTRDGKKVRIICFDAKNRYPIKALVSETDTTEIFAEYTATGGFYQEERKDPLDLMMVSVKKTGWINIYELRNRPTERGGRYIYPTKQEAIDNAMDAVLATVKIEWEE